MAFVDQDGGDGAVDTPRKSADHLLVAHLGADAGNLLLAEGGHTPVAGETGDGGG